MTCQCFPKGTDAVSRLFPDKFHASHARVLPIVLGLLSGLAPCLLALNPPPSQVYYVPFPEDNQLSGYVGINSAAVDPLAVFVTFSASADNTVIYYDHWEDGYEKDITNPTQSTTQVFGDGNPANGYPPGNAGDLIAAGTIFSLRNYVTSTTLQSVLDYDARDKVASFKPISLTKTTFPASTNTLLAGCVEVFEQGLWGTEYRVPVGADMPTTTATSTLTWDADIFSYSAVSIMAGAGGASVQIDANNDGTFEQTVSLAEGATTYVTGVNAGARVLANRPVQVVYFSGRPTSNYQSRDTTLLPVYRWSSSYYAPVSTAATNGTTVFLYNPGTSAITVSYDYRSSTSAYTTATVSVPAGGNARVNLSPASGTTHYGAYKFYTTGANPPVFYAFSAVDASSATVGNNQAYDGGFTLVGQPSLTTQVLVSLGIGRDPYSSTNPTENGNPVWITTAGNGHTVERVYVDYNGDNAGTLTDPNGNKYDVHYDLRELQQQKLFDPDGDQSGMLVYVLNPNVKIAAAWAQDPAVATAGQPGLDVSTLIPPLREGDAAKGSSVAVDADGDGYDSAGDTLEYDIRVINTARTGVNGPFTVKDNLPADTTYVPGSTKYRYSVGGAWQAWVAVPDDLSGTAFPLDGAGYGITGTLGYNQQIQVSFLAVVDTYANLTPGTTSITNTGTVEVMPYGLTININWSDILYGSIGNRVWVDTDGDGVQDSGEAGLNGVTVYADLDNDGIRDAGEPFAVTSGNGDYLLAGLTSGTYVVRVDAASVAAIDPRYGPTYDLDGLVTGYAATVALAAAQDRDDADFGFRIGASVGDRVWVDRDGDGAQEAGEPGINGVRVFLDLNTNGAFDPGEPNSATFGDGNYYIGNLAAGTYAVRVDTSTLPSGATQTYDLNGVGTPHVASVTLLASEHNGNLDFGYRGTLSIGDLVWEDINADALYTTPTVYNVYNGRVDINNSGAADNNDDGFIGTMRIVNGYVDIDNDASTTTPDADDDGVFLGYTIINGGFDIDGNASISTADDGTATYAPEPGIANVRVYIDANGNGIRDLTEAFATTNASGAYSITNLFNGTYSVRVDTTSLPASLSQTYDLTSPVTDNQATVTLSGTSRTDADFGYRNDATLGDRVWNDMDNDGVQDAGEPGIEGVLVYIDADADGLFDQGVERFVVTDVNGNYTINNLAAGTYSVRIEISTLPRSSTQTYDLDGVGTAHAASRTLATSEDAVNVDFGYRSTASVGNFVWLDADADGVQDAGETGINGVRVYLDINGNGVFDSATEPSTTTASGGAYTISGLVAGTYTARIDTSTLPAGMVPTYDLAGDLDHAATFMLNSGQVRTDVDFGYTQPVLIGDRVWNDLDADGVQDGGEPGLDGVTVTAWLASNNTVAATTTTSGGGAYSFPSLLPGTYYVEFSTLPGYNRTLADQGADGVDSDANVSTGKTANVTLTSGQSNLTLDAGYYQPVAIGDFVWNDLNADGLQNGGETGLDGVSVTLYRPGFGPDGIAGNADDSTAVATTTTAGGGAYSFTGPPPGTYQVEFGTLAGYSRAPANQGGDDAVDSDADASTGLTGNIILAAGTADNSIDAGLYQPGAISGAVLADTDGNGTGDAPLQGVTLTLLDSSGNPVDGDPGTPGVQARVTTTAPDGSYSFDNLVPGFYRIAETQPAGYFSVVDKDGGNPDLIGDQSLIAVTAGATNTGNDFVEQQAGSVSGLVLQDDDNDGDGDSPLANVEVRLTDNKGVTVATTFTGPDGSYTFNNVVPGNYTIIEVQPGTHFTVGDGDTTNPSDDAPNTSQGDDSIPVGVLPGEHDDGNLFIEELPAFITGHVYADTDNDGDGDVPIPGVTLTLLDTAGNPVDGDPNTPGLQILTEITDVNGSYSFDNIAPGTYGVGETQPSGYLSVSDKDGGNPDEIRPISVLGGQTSSGNDFVEEQPGTVAGHLYLDTNGDGNQDPGEPDLAGVDVKVTDSDGAIQTVTTGATGNWTASVPPGSTTADVDETDPQYPAGSTQTEGTDPTTVTAVAGSTVDGGIDGYYLPGAISGTVWSDIDNNGSGDSGIPNVTLILKDSNGDPVGTTVTLADGTYSFGNLPPGTYTVTELQPSGYLSVSDVDGGNPDLIGDVAVITVTAGMTTGSQDFLERPMACPNKWSDWQNKWDGPTGGQTGPAQNPDGDIYSNLIEYAFCMPPNKGILSPFCLDGSLTDQGAIDGVFRRTAGGATDVLYELQFIADLTLSPGGWTTIALDPGDLQVTVNPNGTETVRILDLESVTGLTSGSGFVRMRVSLDADGDNVPEAVDTTEAGGWVDSALGLACRTYNNPFLSCPPISATIDSVSGQNLVLATSGAGHDFSTMLTPGAAYYAEVVAGDHEGARFDITGAGVDSLTLALDNDLCGEGVPHNTLTGPLPATLAGDQIVVRRHWTLGEMFPPGVFTPFATMAAADKVQFLVNGSWSTYWLYDDAGTPKWVRDGDNTLTDQGGLVVPPGRGVFINCRQTTGALTALGKVRANDFARPLCQNPDAVAGGYPVDSTAVTRGMNSASGFFGSLDPKKADQFFVWKGDSVPNANGYDSYFLLRGPQPVPTYDWWAKQGDAGVQNRNAETLFLRDRSVVTGLKAALPAYQMPAPWQP